MSIAVRGVGCLRPLESVACVQCNRVAGQGHKSACLAMWLESCLLIGMSEERTQEGWSWYVVCRDAARVFE